MTAAEQIAQKLHAVSDPNEHRPRDLIDIYLLAARLRPADAEVLDHCVRTFEDRATHPVARLVGTRAVLAVLEQPVDSDDGA